MGDVLVWRRAGANYESTDGHFIISQESGLAPCSSAHAHQDGADGRCPGGSEHLYRYWTLRARSGDRIDADEDLSKVKRSAERAASQP